MAQLLLSQGVSIDQVDAKGANALNRAVYKDQKEMVQFLIEHGANPNFISQISGYAPLHVAIQRKKFDIIELLVNYEKTDINLSNANGSTPLDMAAEREIVIVLASYSVMV